MTIIRIIQAKSIAHTEFKLMPDYRPVPRINFELAREWAHKGLLEPFDASFVELIQNMMNFTEAVRRIETKLSVVTHNEVDEYVARLQRRGVPGGNTDGPACDSSAM